MDLPPLYVRHGSTKPLLVVGISRRDAPFATSPCLPSPRRRRRFRLSAHGRQSEAVPRLPRGFPQETQRPAWRFRSCQARAAFRWFTTYASERKVRSRTARQAG